MSAFFIDIRCFLSETIIDYSPSIDIFVSSSTRKSHATVHTLRDHTELICTVLPAYMSIHNIEHGKRNNKCEENLIN